MAAKEKPKKPDELAEDLLKLLNENAKPIVRRTGANKLEVEIKGRKFAFEIAARRQQKRRDIG